MEVKFEMELELPSQPKEVQKGSVIQDGKKYQVKMKDQEITPNGKAVDMFKKIKRCKSQMWMTQLLPAFCRTNDDHLRKG